MFGELSEKQEEYPQDIPLVWKGQRGPQRHLLLSTGRRLGTSWCALPFLPRFVLMDSLSVGNLKGSGK